MVITVGMRVAMIGDYPSPGESAAGGVASAVAAIIQPLSAMVDLSLVVPNASVTQCVSASSVEIRYIKGGYGPGMLRYWTTDARRIGKVIESMQPDIVHVQGAAGWGLWLPAIPAVVTVHGIPHLNAAMRRSAGVAGRFAAFVKRYGTAAVEKASRRHLGNVIVISEYVLEELPDIRDLTYAMIPNPVHQRFIDCSVTNLSIPGRMLVAGRIEPAKGVVEAIQILGKLVNIVPGANLVLAGPVTNPKYKDYCSRIARELGVESRVQFLGRCSQESMIEQYDMASCLVVTSHQETAPVVVSEALVRGLPVAALEKFGLKTMIIKGDNGLFIPASSFDQQAHVVARVLEMGKRRENIAYAARNVYSPMRVAQQIVDFYGRVRERRSRAASAA
jgi:glycosyltransferase involved in cell wall biosynthesis